MRAIFLLGGFVGFAVVALAGWMAGRSGDRVLMDAAIGCLAGAILFRWFWSSVTRVLVEAVNLKRAARRLAEESAATAKAAAAPVKQNIR